MTERTKTEQVIQDVAQCLSSGVQVNLIKWILISEGWSEDRAQVIISWAQRFNESKNKE